jgi:serine/threonine protein kinase
MQAIGASFAPKAIRWLCDEVKQPPYVLAMERCERSLQDYLDHQQSDLDRDVIITICKQIATAITAMHQARIVHCDLKPGNVMCRSGQFRWLLIDFDSSCMINEPVRNHTPNYGAPEVLTGGAKTLASEAIDVWAFGCIMYELFTRRPLFPNGEEDVRSLCEQRKGKEKLFNFFSKEIPETIQQRLFEILVESPEKRPRMEEILERPPFVTYTRAVKEARNEGRVEAIGTLSPKLEGIHSGVQKTLQVSENLLENQEKLSNQIGRIFEKLEDLQTLIVETPNAVTPRLFLVLPAEKPTEKWRQWLSSLKSIRAHQLCLHLVCECEWFPHCMEKSYSIEEPREFFKKMGPILGICLKVFNMLTSLSPINVPGVPPEITDWIAKSGNSLTEYFDIMKQFVQDAIEEKAISGNLSLKTTQSDIRIQAARDQLYREFSVFLDRLDPGKKFSGLARRPVKLESGKENFLWLCDRHIAEYSSKGRLTDTSPFQKGTNQQ